MRISGGSYRGRLIKAPKKFTGRPTEERVRQALFNTLASWMEGAEFLDLFCGTGAVGLEALSRGAGKAVFVDMDPSCVACVEEHAELFKIDAALWEATEEDALHAPSRLAASGRRFDFIFLDPPYESDAGARALKALGELDILKPLPQARVILEHGKTEDAPESAGKLHKVRENRYGNSILSFYSV